MPPVRQHVRQDRDIDLQPGERLVELQQITNRWAKSMGLGAEHDIHRQAYYLAHSVVYVLPSHRLHQDCAESGVWEFHNAVHHSEYGCNGFSMVRWTWNLALTHWDSQLCLHGNILTRGFYQNHCVKEGVLQRLMEHLWFHDCLFHIGHPDLKICTVPRAVRKWADHTQSLEDRSHS